MNSTCEYGIRCVLYLLTNRRMTTSQEISENLHISIAYTYKVMKQLNEAGMVEIIRGSNGGYKASRELEQRTLWDVIQIFDPIVINDCLVDHHSCNLNRMEFCKVHKVYQKLQKTLEKELKGIKLYQLKEEEE